MKRSEDIIRILLADEHRLVRSAISSLIETFDNMSVVAEVESEDQLMKAAAHDNVNLFKRARFFKSAAECLSRYSCSSSLYLL